MDAAGQSVSRLVASAPLPFVLDTSRYEPVSTFSYEERAAMASIVDHLHSDKSMLSMPQLWRYGPLQRLLSPVCDFLSTIYADRPRQCPRQRVPALLIERMHTFRTPFWIWSSDEWVSWLRQDTSSHEGPLDREIRPDLLAIAYVFCGFRDLHKIGFYSPLRLACRVFGDAGVRQASDRVTQLALEWGYVVNTKFHTVLTEAMLYAGTAVLDDIGIGALEAGRSHSRRPQDYIKLSRILVGLGTLPQRLEARGYVERHAAARQPKGVPQAWADVCQRWRETTTLSKATRDRCHYQLLKVGRWLASTHPEIEHPKQWTRELAVEYVAAVDRMTDGDFSHPGRVVPLRAKPLSPGSKVSSLNAVRTFFHDLQEWGWIPTTFNPARWVATPRSIKSLLGPAPRVIADEVWLKLLSAGLSLSATDLAPAGRGKRENGEYRPRYPLEMVRAVVVVWLFAGLRKDELFRLRVGCIRWHKPSGLAAADAEPAKTEKLCWLDVPVNKTSAAFTKPVDRIVGEAIARWEAVRPVQPASIDRKTGEQSHMLFSYRGYRLGSAYINDTLIPLLCKKAGVPEHDARGRITSHRARATIATQLFNAREPLSLFELQEWLGHKHPNTTQYYARVTPTKLAKAYTDAGYFERNVRMIDVLIDQDAVRSGAAAAGEPWRYYDLGPGYCTYDFFDQCPHRMACARCTFFRPKHSAQAQLLESKNNILRLQQKISLTDEERLAAEDDVAALQRLIDSLADVRTPSGETPRQLKAHGRRQLPVIQSGGTLSHGLGQ